MLPTTILAPLWLKGLKAALKERDRDVAKVSLWIKRLNIQRVTMHRQVKSAERQRAMLRKWKRNVQRKHDNLKVQVRKLEERLKVTDVIATVDDLNALRITLARDAQRTRALRAGRHKDHAATWKIDAPKRYSKQRARRSKFRREIKSLGGAPVLWPQDLAKLKEDEKAQGDSAGGPAQATVRAE